MAPEPACRAIIYVESGRNCTISSRKFSLFTGRGRKVALYEYCQDYVGY
jgi:hypothetical protein